MQRLSYRELRERVAECAAALRAIGVARSDRVTGACRGCRSMGMRPWRAALMRDAEKHRYGRPSPRLQATSAIAPRPSS